MDVAARPAGFAGGWEAAFIGVPTVVLISWHLGSDSSLVVGTPRTAQRHLREDYLGALGELESAMRAA
jgi:hypothetical protein